jgi:hypothetical protein
MKINIAMKGWELLNLKRRADKKLESNTEITEHTQTLIKKKKKKTTK